MIGNQKKKILLTERCSHFLANIFDQPTILRVVHEVQKDFNSCQHNRRISML